MELRIGENIKRLRREKGMTQERLAELLNITNAAVSKWEKGDTYPDITAIIPLARIFDVSVDEIMGYDSSKNEAEIERILFEYRQLGFKGKYSEASELIKSARKSYPNDHRIMDTYMWDIAGGSADNDPAVLKAHYEEFMQICDILLSSCTDEDIRLAAITMQAKLLHASGETERALDILSHLPHWYSTSGQKSEQLFAKGTPEFLYWIRRNMYELADGTAFKIVRSLWYTDSLSVTEKSVRSEAVGDGFISLYENSGESVFAVMAHMAYRELQNKLIMSETTQTDINRVTAKRLRLAKIITEDMKKDSVLLDVVNRTYKQYDFDGNLLQWEIDYLKSTSHAGLEKPRKDVEYMTILNKYENG